MGYGEKITVKSTTLSNLRIAVTIKNSNRYPTYRKNTTFISKRNFKESERKMGRELQSVRARK